MKIKNNIAWLILEQLIDKKKLSEIGTECDTKHFYHALYVLVENGFLNYTKLTPKNYYYWWYEVPEGQERTAKKTNFTCNVNDFKITKKGLKI